MQVEILGALDDTRDEKPSNVAADASGKDDATGEKPEPEVNSGEGSTTTPPADGTGEAPASEGSGEHPEGALIDIEGEKLTVAQVKAALEQARQDPKWKDKNRRESEELNREREELARRREELERRMTASQNPLELLRAQAASNPELAKLLNIPAPRDIEAELRAHLANRPDSYDAQATADWELTRDRLNRELFADDAAKRAQAIATQREAEAHNDRIELEARKKYLETKKLNEKEFGLLVRYILDENWLRNGRAPSDAFDRAYREVFRDRYEDEIRVAAAKNSVKSIADAKPRTEKDPGIADRTPPKGEEDADDDEFVRAAKSAARGGYVKLPT